MRIVAAAALTVAAVLTVAIGNPRAAGNFAPTITLETSTTRATAHPDARITIDNSASDENIKDLTLQLPDGFWGSLAAVDSKCTEADAIAGECDASSRIGTVTATALITDPDTGTEADGVLEGAVYMTEAFAGNNDPAGMSIKVEARVGGVDLGDVIVNGRVQAAHAPVPVGAPTGATGKLVGIKTVVADIPQEVDDEVNDRQVSYKLNKMQVDLLSRLEDSVDVEYAPPLLTNPSVCGTTQIAAEATPYGGGPAVQFSDDYVVDGCDTTNFDPTVTYEFSEEPVPTDTEIGLKTSIEFPSNPGQPVSNSSIDTVSVVMPRGFGANFPAYGGASDKCQGGSASLIGGVGYFSPANCSGTGTAGVPEAKIGTVSIVTPMLPDPVSGNVYLINKTPLPWLGIDVNDSIAGNPKGIKFALAGVTNLTEADPNCVSSCEKLITAKFAGVPDTPTTKIDIDLDKPDRPNPPSPSATLSSKILVGPPSDETCQPVGEASTDLTSGSGSVVGRIQSVSFDGCPIPRVAATTGPWGDTTASSSPTFGFEYTGPESTLWCGIDGLIGAAEDCSGESSYSKSGLDNGTHSIIVTDSAVPADGIVYGTYRRFAVKSTTTPDTVVPSTALTAGPGTPGPGAGTTADPTPSFTFNASEASAFQCSVDGGAFLPCGESTGTEDVSYEIPEAEAFEASDVEHSFRVRAQDEAGNVDLTPAEATFKIEIPFEPTVDVALTDTTGRGHPEMTLSVANDSHEDLDDFSFSMPDGFFGGLTGVQSLCPVANADAGTCGPGSQVGTVTATAIVDRTTARIKGKVFLTETRNAGDPAGLTIDVTPKLQDVTFEPVRVTARLMVRGEAEGINTVTVDIPNTTETTIGEVSEYDIRSMVLKLVNNPAAPQPLLTNPSSCGDKSFDASFKGYDDTVATASDTIAFTGCENLGFAPQVSMSVSKRGTYLPPAASKNGIPEAVDLDATVTSNPGDAGIKNVDVLMPKPVTMNVNALTFQCSIEEQAADACPAHTRIGKATAISPLLPEPISGEIYLFKPQPGQTAATLPRLFIRLRGRIDVDLFAVNRFENVTQLRSTFTNLPDVPLSSFNMTLDGFLSTRNESCSYPKSEWNATGTMVGHNGKQSSVVNPLSFDCPLLDGPLFSVSYKYAGKKGVKSRATITTEAQTGTKLKKTTIRLPRGFKLNTKSLKNKKRLKKLIVVKGGNKKLSIKCFKVRSTTKIEVNQCKKRYDKVTVQLKAGAFARAKKTKKPAFKVQIVDSANKKVNAKKL